MPFSANEEYIIRDRFQYISFINIAQNMNISEGFLELQLGTVDLAFLALVAEISESDLDKTHELLLHGFLLTKRRLLLEVYLGKKLEFLKSQSDVLLKNDGEFLGLKGNPDTFYLCYWKVFVPGRAPQETTVSPLFSNCIKENQSEN